MASNPSTPTARVSASPWEGVHGTAMDSDRHYARHWHATYGFGLMERGAQRSASGRGQVDAQAGDLITTNPGEVHDGKPLGAASRRWRMVYLTPAALARLAGTGDDFAVTRPVIVDAPLRAGLLQLFARLDAWEQGRMQPLGCEEALVRVCGALVERHGSRVAPREIGGELGRVRERLADELQNPPTLDELAAMVGASKYQLLRRFEKACGLPPHAWLQQQRAERARGLIRRGLALAEVAAECGFSDQSHMTRVFTRQYGFTPGAWRAAALQ
jgi:AraC-like DNA-binding protein